MTAPVVPRPARRRRSAHWTAPSCTADGVVAVSTITGWRCPFCGAAVPDQQGRSPR